MTLTKMALLLLWRLLKLLWIFARKVLFPLLKAGYYRLPERKRIPVSLLVVLLIGVGCTYLVYSGLPGLKKDPADAAIADLMAASDIPLLSGSWEEQKQAAKDVLRNAGFDVLEGSDAPREGVPFILSPELTMLTYDANRKPEGGGRLTLQQFAEMMRDFGFPFAEGKDPAALLQSGIRHWVQRAKANPGLPGAAAPLFLAEMAKAQVPSIDLTGDDWTPSEYRMTLLEMQVFLGAFYQAMPDEPTAEIGFIDRLIGTRTAYASETSGLPACASLKQWFNDWGKKQGQATEALVAFDVDLVTLLTAELTGKGMEYLSGLIDQGIAKLIGKMKGVAQEVAKIAGKVLQVISILMKLQKLAMLYSALEVKVTPDQGLVHMPGPDDKEENIRFTAVVGVNDQAYQEYLNEWNASKIGKDVKDCLSFAGLPSWTDSGDVAADVDNWSVEWKLLEGGNTLVTWGEDGNEFEYKGQQQTKVTRTDKNKGETYFTTNVVEEKVKNHRGEEKIGTVVVQASVETAGMPPILAQLVNGGKIAEGGFTSVAESALWGLLGIADTLADIVTGWYQSLVQPTGYGFSHVTYHDKDDGPLVLGKLAFSDRNLEQHKGDDRTRFEYNYTEQLELLERLRLERDEYGNELWIYKAHYSMSGKHIGTYVPNPKQGDSCPAEFRNVDVSWDGTVEAKVLIREDENFRIDVMTDSINLDESGYDCYNPELDYHIATFNAVVFTEGKTGSVRGSKRSDPSVIDNDAMKSTSEYTFTWDLTVK